MSCAKRSASPSSQGVRPGDTASIDLASFDVRYRGQSLAIELERDTVSVHATHCVPPSLRVAVNGEIHHVVASAARRFSLT
jgi:hypothetical protein